MIASLTIGQFCFNIFEIFKGVKMIFLQIRQKGNTDFMRLFLICIFIKFSLLSHSSPLSLSGSLASFSTSAKESSEISIDGESKIPLGENLAEETVSPIDLLADDAQNYVWRIRNSLFSGSGTAFPTGPNLFVTGFHVMVNALQSNDTIKNIVLEQEHSSSHLTIGRIIRVSALYDLVLFETEESVTNYLTLAEDLPQPDDKLFIWGYPKGKFQELKNTGKLTDVGHHHYTFPTNSSYIGGASGSPVLDEEGQVVGVTSKAASNMLLALKADELKDLIVGDIGLNCSNLINPVMCMKEGLENLKTMAEQDNALAQYRLATMYYKGKTLEKDLNLALSWMEKSAEQEYAPAQFFLAEMFLKGIGTKKDFELAFYWYKESAFQGYVLAQYKLAMILHEGVEIEKDLDVAFYWMKKPAEQGYVLAQYHLAVMYHNGEGIERNHNLAFAWFQKSAEQNFVPAQRALLAMYLEGKVVEDFSLIFNLAKENAMRDDIIAQNVLATMYYKGEGTEKDLNKAFIWYKRSAEMGYTPSQYHLAVMYYNGEGVERNRDLALLWCIESAAQGYILAQKFLENAYREQANIN